jgi:hypothetical protein
MKLTAEIVRARWPVLFMVIRAAEWWSEPDLQLLLDGLGVEAEFAADQLESAEAELKALSGCDVAIICDMEPGEIHDKAPNASLVLNRYFN